MGHSKRIIEHSKQIVQTNLTKKKNQYKHVIQRTPTTTFESQKTIQKYINK